MCFIQAQSYDGANSNWSKIWQQPIKEKDAHLSDLNFQCVVLIVECHFSHLSLIGNKRAIFEGKKRKGKFWKEFPFWCHESIFPIASHKNKIK